MRSRSSPVIVAALVAVMDTADVLDIDSDNTTDPLSSSASRPSPATLVPRRECSRSGRSAPGHRRDTAGNSRM
jgi:hypothetical protein